MRISLHLKKNPMPKPVNYKEKLTKSNENGIFWWEAALARLHLQAVSMSAMAQRCCHWACRELIRFWRLHLQAVSVSAMTQRCCHWACRKLIRFSIVLFRNISCHLSSFITNMNLLFHVICPTVIWLRHKVLITGFSVLKAQHLSHCCLHWCSLWYLEPHAKACRGGTPSSRSGYTEVHAQLQAFGDGFDSFLPVMLDRKENFRRLKAS